MGSATYCKSAMVTSFQLCFSGRVTSTKRSMASKSASFATACCTQQTRVYLACHAKTAKTNSTLLVYANGSRRVTRVNVRCVRRTFSDQNQIGNKCELMILREG